LGAEKAGGDAGGGPPTFMGGGLGSGVNKKTGQAPAVADKKNGAGGKALEKASRMGF